MNENNVVSTRVNNELFACLDQQSAFTNRKISDLLRDAILLYKQQTELPEKMRFTNGFHIKADKTSILTYRLLESFIKNTQADVATVFNNARELAKRDFDAFRDVTIMPETETS